MHTNPYLLVCNGSPTSGTGRRGLEWATVNPQLLFTASTRRNVVLKITDITDAMAKKLPPVVEDLVELSALVYAADQACKRLGGNSFEYGSKWRRSLRFEIAVREPTFWNQPSVIDLLCSGLGFLSDDDYEFEFTAYKDPPNFGEYLEYPNGAATPKPPARVMLFSAGLDSLAGAAEEIFVHGRRVALVSHKPVDHLAAKQRDLVDDMRRRARDVAPNLGPLHFAVKANKDGTLTRDNTQRSRSFLYASMAAAVADVFGLDEIYFYENGVVSVNLPLCGQEVGGRATRTTHPQVLHQLEQLFSLVLGRPFEIRNEYMWDTKEDVLRRLLNSGHVDLARQSFSCVHTRRLTLGAPHCGLCSQCISRWLASLGSDYGEHDPATGYFVNVLTGPRRKDEERILAERYIGWARRVERMTTVRQFNQAFAGELARVYPHLRIPDVDAAAKLFELHHRHAEQVGRAMMGPMRDHLQQLWLHRLPDTCALAYAFDPKRAAAPELKQSAASVATAHPSVRLQGLHKPVFVRDQEKPPLTDSGYKVVEALVTAGEKGMKKSELERVCGDPRGILHRLRKKDPDWEAAIQLAGGTGRRYRIV